MALKFGSIFDNFLAGFKASKGGTTGGKESSETPKVDLSDVHDELKNVESAAKEAADQIILLEDDLINYTVGTTAYAEAERKLNTAKNNAKVTTEQETQVRIKLDKEQEKVIKNIDDEVKSKVKGRDRVKEVEKDFSNQIDELKENFKLGQIDAKSFQDQLKDLKLGEVGAKGAATIKNMGVNIFKNIGGSLKDTFSGMGDTLGSMAGGGLKSVLGTLMPKFLGPISYAVDALISAATKAIGQIMDLNKSLIDLQRSTGGVVTASKLGYDAMGNSIDGYKSLKTATIEANVSMAEFSGAVASLVDDSFGSTIGGVKIATGEIAAFGAEAAQMKKYYGADIGPTVRRLYQDYGMSVKDATKFVGDASDKAQALGLNVAGFVKNLTEVTNLVGEVYFKSREEMQKMATIASQLGVSVGTLSKGLIKMNGINDLFQQQQRNAALGLGTLSKNLAKIYALRATGKGGEAAKLETTSLAKDMARQGLINKGGEVTQQGIATLEAAGVSKDAIAGISKMAKEAEATGIPIGKLGDVSKLTADEQAKLEQVQKENMSISERLNIAWDSFMQTFIDPIADLLGPVVSGLTDAFEGVIAVVKPIASFLMTALITPLKFVGGMISGFFKSVGETFSGVGKKLSALWEKIQPAFSAIGKVFSFIGDLLGKALAIPLKIIGTVLGWVIDAFTWLIDKAVMPIINLFKKVWAVIDEYIITPISDTLGPVFDAIGDALSDLWSPIQAVIDGISDLIDYLDWFGDDENQPEDFATDWNSVLGTDTPVSPATTAPSAANTIKPIASSISADNEKTNKLINDAVGSKSIGGNKTTNVVLNNNVSGVVPSAQSIKVST